MHVGSRTIRRVITITVVLIAVAGINGHSRDFPEPPTGLVVRGSDQPFSIGGPISAYSSFTPQAIQASPSDQFQIRQWVNGTLFQAGRFSATAYYASFLLTGPPTMGREPGSRLQWLMNSVQFEYGLTAQYDLGKSVVLGEYSRRSQHPFLSEHDDPSGDMVRLGYATPELERPLAGGELKTVAMLRGAYNELWEMWGAPGITEIRQNWSAIVQTEIYWYSPMQIGRTNPAAFLAATVEPMWTQQDEFKIDRWLEIGLSVGTRRGALELYLDHFGSADSESLDERPNPVSLWGYGIRMRSAPFAR